MDKGTEPTAVLDGRLDEGLAERVFAAAAELAELDPEAVRQALWSLQGDPSALRRLEAGLSLPPERATLALGAAIQLARAELSSAGPDLHGCLPEVRRWLEGRW
jgi:hypothetical protein